MLQMSTHNLQLVQVLICPQLNSGWATIFQRSVDKKLNKGISVLSKHILAASIKGRWLWYTLSDHLLDIELVSVHWYVRLVAMKYMYFEP